MDNRVSLVKIQSNSPSSIKEALSTSLSLVDFKPVAHAKTIVIKANLCYYWNASTGFTTDPLLVGAIIDYLRETFGSNTEIKIAEADASAMQTKYAFRVLGYRKLAEQKKVELLNLSEDEIQETETQVDGHKMVLRIPQVLVKSDLFINVPKLKVMRRVFITCAMKNLFGAIAYPRKLIYHPLLEETIVGANKILKPHLNIVDGIFALGRFPIKLNLVMAGSTSFSVDWVAAQIAGYNPSKIKFLNMAIRENLGNARSITVVGEEVESFKKIFPTENHSFSTAKMKLQLSLMKAYSRMAGDIIPPGIEER